MATRVIYTACSLPGWVEVARRLHAEAGWTPCYWTGRAQVADAVRECFPGAVFHEHADAIRGVPPPECRDLELPVIDEDLLWRLAVHESIALRMMDRFDYAGRLTHSERRRLYHAHLRYWSAVLERYRPDVVFNVSTPHQVYDYVLYALCKERGIRTVMVGIAFDLDLVFGKVDYEDGSGNIAGIYRQRLASGNRHGHAALSPAIAARLEKVRGPYDAAIPPIVSWVMDLESAISRLSPYRKAVRNLRTYAGLMLGAARAALAGSPGDDMQAEAALGRLRQLVYQDVVGPLRTARLRRYYEGLADAVDLRRPYVYVPLSYQPELSSSPEGGLFVEQVLMVTMLAKALPPDWLVYVKEHPVQFTYVFGTNRCVRSYEFYDDLVALPNVRLVPLTVTPFDLIDGAHAVATVTGTSGWEAIVRGRPVLHFGYPWWQGCEGAFYTPSIAACREALEQILAGYEIDQEKVLRFLEVVEEESCSGELYTNRDLQPLSADESPRVRELARELARMTRRFPLETAR